MSKPDQGKYWGNNVPFSVYGFDFKSVPEAELRKMYDQWREMRYRLDPEILNLIAAVVGPQDKVLEVGIGAGMDFCEISKRCREAFGVDLSHDNVERVRTALRLLGFKGDVRQGSALELPFPDGTFDTVYSYGVLHHTGDTQKAIHECRRVLKPGGKLGLMLYHRWWGTYVSWVIVWMSGRRFYDKDPYCDIYTEAAARKMLDGFDVERVWYETPRDPAGGWRDRLYWWVLDHFHLPDRGSFMMITARKR